MRKRLIGNQKKELVLKQSHLNDEEIERLESYPHPKTLDLNVIIAQNRKEAAKRLIIKPIVPGMTIEFISLPDLVKPKTFRSDTVNKLTKPQKHTKSS